MIPITFREDLLSNSFLFHSQEVIFLYKILKSWLFFVSKKQSPNISATFSLEVQWFSSKLLIRLHLFVLLF